MTPAANDMRNDADSDVRIAESTDRELSIEELEIVAGGLSGLLITDRCAGCRPA
jgi:hypothetical protein